MTTTEVRRASGTSATPPLPRVPRRDDTRQALAAAAVVLLLWSAWLLVPGHTRVTLLGGGSVDGPAASPRDGQDRAREQRPRQDRTPTQARGADRALVARRAAVAAGPREPSTVRGVDVSVLDVAGEGEVPPAGDGTFAVAPGTGAQVGDGELVRYTVEVEGGVPLEAAQVADVVEAVLADPRSWTAQGRWALQRVDADPDARIVLTSPDTTDRLCAPLRTRGELSCRNGDHVVLNAVRWTRGATSWGDDLAGYQQYVVNHELGHFLGNGHVSCPAAGQAAPVMLQQTIGLQGCTANAWPYP